MPGRIVVVEGPSGAGKSTLVRAVVKSFGWTALPEAFDRLSPRPDLTVPTEAALLRTEQALAREELRRSKEAHRLRSAGHLVIADTGFAGPLTYTAGLIHEGWAAPAVFAKVRRFATPSDTAGPWTWPDLLVYLDVPAATARDRAVRDPERHPPELVGRHAAVAGFERAFYRDLGQRFPAAGIRFVRPTESPASVAERVRQLAAEGAVPPEGLSFAEFAGLLEAAFRHR
jgi:thymidylate kinase